MHISTLRLNDQGTLVFCWQEDGVSDESTEIFTIDASGQNLRRLTDNNYWDFTQLGRQTESVLLFFLSGITILTIAWWTRMGRIIMTLRQVFAGNFLFNTPIFSLDDSEIHFIGEWCRVKGGVAISTGCGLLFFFPLLHRNVIFRRLSPRWKAPFACSSIFLCLGYLKCRWGFHPFLFFERTLPIGLR